MADRAQSEAFLQGRSIAYDQAASDEALAAQVLAIRDADHARYLESYQPVITRLPQAVGSSPEQPEPPAEDDEQQPPADHASADAEPVAPTEAPPAPLTPDV